MTIPQALELALQRHQAGRLAEAEEIYRQILAAQPNQADALHLLGVIAQQVGRHEVAVKLICQSIALHPDNPAAHGNLGAAYRTMGRLDEAIAACRRALALKSDFPEAHNNLGIALREQGQLDEAITAYRSALQLKPDYPEAHYNLGIALRERGGIDEAIAAYRHALELNPNYPEALNNLGAALAGQGRVDEAIAAYRRALELNPHNAWVHSNLLYTLHFHPDHNERTISEERRRWNRQFGEPMKPFIRPHANDRSPERPLRVGYVSPDFRDHVVGRYLLPLFERHDRGSFEILCYAGVVEPDRFTERFRQQARLWRSTADVSDEALAEAIRRDGVDILVDLTQHMAGNRLPMFARQPAPVQVSLAGYPESTGLETIEYRISDRYLEPDTVDGGAGGKERVRLIDSFYCYDPCGMEVEINPLPALQGGTLTFGSLNHFRKINGRLLSLWARVLGRGKEFRLIISSSAGSQRERTLEALAREGVEARRVEFVEFRPRREYLELHHRLDIVLDTFPYNGGVTTCDALWMGVPVVSLAGETPVSRAGLSLLTNLGLPELVARSETEFVNIAEGLARDLPRLAELRSTLRDRMKRSVLMDAPRFARNIEAAYRSMWERWLAKDEG